MNKIKCLVIDDEFFNRGLITMLITKLNDGFTIAGEAESVNEGYKMIQEIKPDVVFLDIKMPDGSGFDLLKRFTRIDFEVVFITGFDQYALEAFEHSALDYVLKPIDLDKFSHTLQRVQNRIHKSIPNLNHLRDTPPNTFNMSTLTKIPIHEGDSVTLLLVYEIQSVQTKEEQTVFLKEDNRSHSTSKPLAEFEFILDALPGFYKINENTYINASYVVQYSKGESSFVTLKNGSTFEIPATISLDALVLPETKKEH